MKRESSEYYRIKGFVCPTTKKTGFILPVFNNSDSFFIQEIDYEDIIRKFVSCVEPHPLYFISSRDFYPLREGDSALYAFAFRKDDILFGDREELASTLNDRYDELIDLPFTQVNVAAFLQDSLKFINALNRVERESISSGISLTQGYREHLKNTLSKWSPQPLEVLVQQALICPGIPSESFEHTHGGLGPIAANKTLYIPQVPPADSYTYSDFCESGDQLDLFLLCDGLGNNWDSGGVVVEKRIINPIKSVLLQELRKADINLFNLKENPFSLSKAALYTFVGVIHGGPLGIILGILGYTMTITTGYCDEGIGTEKEIEEALSLTAAGIATKSLESHVTNETWNRICDKVEYTVKKHSAANLSIGKAIRLIYDAIAAVDKNAASQWLVVYKTAFREIGLKE